MKKEITIKYKANEFMLLKELYERTVCVDMSKDIEDRLLIAVLLNVYRKIYKQAVEMKSKYSLKYRAEEAIAFILYFNGYPAQNIYEQLLINATIEKADRTIL